MSTRVAVHCYQGDAPLVESLLPLHRRHGLPITIISPEDSQVWLPGVDCRQGGLRQSVGPLAIARQREHMRILLTYPEDFFLMHDSDSLCVSAALPTYLYVEPTVLWSNLVINGNLSEQAAYAPGVPKLALQPPVFASRGVIEALLAVTEAPMDGFIDHWFAQAATRAGIAIKGFRNGVSLPICTHPGNLMLAQVEARYKGAVFFHSVKSPRFWLPLIQAHQNWLDDGPGVDDRPVVEHEYVHSVWAGDRMEYQPGIHPTLAAPVARPRPTRDSIGRLIRR